MKQGPQRQSSTTWKPKNFLHSKDIQPQKQETLPEDTPSDQRALASTTSEATTTPQIKNLIGGTCKKKRAARASRTLEHDPVQFSAK